VHGDVRRERGGVKVVAVHVPGGKCIIKRENRGGVKSALWRWRTGGAEEAHGDVWRKPGSCQVLRKIRTKLKSKSFKPSFWVLF
jgi:hypothetical protein